MKKVLVTGAAGFVGRHFTRRFLQGGHEVHAVDAVIRQTGGIDPNEGWPLFEPRDFSSFYFYRQDCRQWFRERRDTDFDYCFHLAAIVGGRMMIENNPLAVSDDLSIDAAYWQWAAAVKARKSVMFSSSAAYPIRYQRRENYALLREDMIEIGGDVGMPDMSYGWAKLTCEYLGKLAYEKHGLKSVVYRPFSGYGEDQDDSYPFPSICKRAIANRGSSVVTVWGSGDQMRDFIHIADCVDAVLTTMDEIENGDAVNLSTGIYTSFKQLAYVAANVCGYRPEVTGTSNTPEGVFARAGDTRKQRQLGCHHRISLREGIERAIRCYENGLV